MSGATVSGIGGHCFLVCCPVIESIPPFSRVRSNNRSTLSPIASSGEVWVACMHTHTHDHSLWPVEINELVCLIKVVVASYRDSRR